MKRGDPKASVRTVQDAVRKMRKADDVAAELRSDFYAAVRKAREHGVKLEALARVTGLTSVRLSQIANEETRG